MSIKTEIFARHSSTDASCTQVEYTKRRTARKSSFPNELTEPNSDTTENPTKSGPNKSGLMSQ